MPDESRAFPDESRPGQEVGQAALVPNIVVISSEGKGKADRLELNDFSHKRDFLKQQNVSSDPAGGSQLVLGASQLSVQVGEVKTTHVPEPLQAVSLSRGRELTSRSTEREPRDDSSSGRLENDTNLPPQANSFTDSDYSSTKSSPGYACSSISAELYDGELLELDKRALEKMSSISPFNLSGTSPESDKAKKGNLDLSGDDSMWDLTCESRAWNPTEGCSPRLSNVSSKVGQTRDSVNLRSTQDDDEDDDGQSTRSRRSVKKGVGCCYHAFMHCVEETPAMLSGLLLSIVFCVVIIVVIPATGRVR